MFGVGVLTGEIRCMSVYDTDPPEVPKVVPKFQAPSEFRYTQAFGDYKLLRNEHRRY